MNTQMYPFLRIAIVLVAGIMVGDMLYGHVPVIVMFGVLAVLVCATIVAYTRSNCKKLTTLLLMLDVFVLGIWNVGRMEQRLDVPLNGQTEMYDAVVAERPVVGQRTIRCVLAVAEGRLAGQRISAFFQKDSAIGDVQRLAVGDGVRVVSRLKPITNSRRLQNGHFDYVRYQHIHGVVARTYINKDSWKRSRVSMRRLGVMQRVLIGMRSARDRLLLHNEKHNMSESAYAVVAAMTMGDRSGLTRELRFASWGDIRFALADIRSSSHACVGTGACHGSNLGLRCSCRYAAECVTFGNNAHHFCIRCFDGSPTGVAQYTCLCCCGAVGGQSVESLGCRIPDVVSCCAWHRDAQYAIGQFGNSRMALSLARDRVGVVACKGIVGGTVGSGSVIDVLLRYISVLFSADQSCCYTVGYDNCIYIHSDVCLRFLGMDARCGGNICGMDGNAYEHVAWIYSLPARRLYVWYTY